MWLVRSDRILGRGLRAGLQMGLRVRLWFTVTQAHQGYHERLLPRKRGS